MVAGGAGNHESSEAGLMSLVRRIWNVLRPGRLERELEDELAFHRDMRIHRLRERGLSAAEAEREVSRLMGNTSIAKDDMRSVRIANWLASSVNDLQHGLVLLRR